MVRLPKCILALAALIAAASSEVLAQPFGISAGTPITSLQVEREINPYRYRVKAPSSHPEFESVIVVATPGQGVCQVSGIGKNHGDDRYGESVRKVFGEIRSQVSATYGNSDLFDHLRRGALWRDSRDWVMAVKQNERSYQASWGVESRATLKNRVKEILLSAVALDSDTSYLHLQFRFDNYAACDAERKSAASRAF